MRILSTLTELHMTVQYMLPAGNAKPYEVAAILAKELDHEDHGELSDEVTRRAKIRATAKYTKWHTACEDEAFNSGRPVSDVIEESQDAGQMPEDYDENPWPYEEWAWRDLIGDAVIEARNAAKQPKPETQF